jgi:hypothetical protein
MECEFGANLFAISLVILMTVTFRPVHFYELCSFQAWLYLLVIPVFGAGIACDCGGFSLGMGTCTTWHMGVVYIYYAQIMSALIALATRLSFHRNKFATIGINMALLIVLWSLFIEGRSGPTVFQLAAFVALLTLLWLQQFVSVDWRTPRPYSEKLCTGMGILAPYLFFTVVLLRWADTGLPFIVQITALEVALSWVVASFLFQMAQWTPV